jgi:hypothetical protein
VTSNRTTRPIGPAWAGYAAALFSLEYAAGKAVMAARGELGVPFHPAPPEAYERFSGDIVISQLGNAGLGLLSAAIALALVQSWSRRIPAAALAGAALAALVSSLAGAVVVATSLTGLRKDHGQWGVDSLLLGALSLVPWLILTVAAIRAARTEGLPSWVRAVRPGRRAALAAATASATYGLLKLGWALGGELLMRETPLPDEARRKLLDREASAVASHWVAVALAGAGIALAWATVRRPRLPRPLIIWLPVLLGALMLIRAAWGAASDVAVLSGAAPGAGYSAGWDLALWSPFFAAWGIAWLLTAVNARRARQTRPQTRAPRLVTESGTSTSAAARAAAAGSVPLPTR